MKPITEGVCMFENYVRAITDIMRVIGVDETVRMLQNSAIQFAENRELLESKRTVRPAARGQA